MGGKKSYETCYVTRMSSLAAFKELSWRNWADKYNISFTQISATSPTQEFSETSSSYSIKWEQEQSLVPDQIFRFPHQERNKERPAPETLGGADEEATQPGRVLGLTPETGDEGNVLTKLQRMISKPLIHLPTLALDNPLAVDGVLRRPYENEAEQAGDASPEQNDTDSLSAYEDASAETPEGDGLLPGAADVELQDDPERSSAQTGEDRKEEPKPGEQCLVS